MKNSLLLLCFLSWSVTVVSQDYLPLAVDDNSWNVLAAGLIPPFPWDTVLSTQTYKISGDTVIDSQIYKKMYSSPEEFPVTWNLQYLLRETNEGRVWFRYASDEKEFLMYDFTLSQGDSAIIGMETDVYIYVDSVTTVTINEVERSRFWMSSKEFEDYHETWIEGIGSDRGIVWSNSVMLVGGFYRLLCMSDTDGLVYMNPDYASCYILTVDIAETVSNSLSVFPNPVRDILILHAGPELLGKDYQLADLMGRVLMNGLLHETVTKISLSEYPHGMYFLQIGTKPGMAIKVMKE